MTVIVVANPKGGVGKSTLSTNLAGWLAASGERVMLGDVDRQQSSRDWLARRPAAARAIASWDVDGERLAKPPAGTTAIVLDTPAGLSGQKLTDVLKLAHRVIVPLQPSMFDILATREFLEKLADNKAVRGGGVEIGIVGMRVDERTRAAEQLHRFVETMALPVVTWLRDTQNYVQLAAHGLTLWDVAPSRVARDLEQWRPLTAWLRG